MGGLPYARTPGERSTTMADDPAHCWDDMTEIDDPEDDDNVAD